MMADTRNTRNSDWGTNKIAVSDQIVCNPAKVGTRWVRMPNRPHGPRVRAEGIRWVIQRFNDLVYPGGCTCTTRSIIFSKCSFESVYFIVFFVGGVFFFFCGGGGPTCLVVTFSKIEFVIYRICIRFHRNVSNMYKIPSKFIEYV